MKCATLIALLLNVSIIKSIKIIDYTNEPYALVPIEPTYLFDSYETVLHLFNITEIEERFLKYEDAYYQHYENDKKITLLITTCKDYLQQLTVHRNKRSWDFLGTGIKFITGTPDHDDMIFVKKEMNELIENNNRLSVINSALKRNLEYLTGKGQGETKLEILFEWIIMELKQIIDTLNLAKSGILNTAALNLEEINKIIKIEQKFDAPLMELLEHSTFKIMQIKSVYILLIKYPIIKEKCMLYNVKPIETENGKLQLESFATQCNGTYNTVHQCKKYINTNLCKYHEHTCTEELLNGFKTNCTIIRERMNEIEQIDDGKILINGIHKINNVTSKGTYLILFNDSVLIDNGNYTNDKELVQQYLQKNRPSQYEILDVIESQNEKLKIPTLNMIKKIPITIQSHPIKSVILIILFVVLIMISFHFMIKLCNAYNAYKIRKENEKANEHVRTLFKMKLGTISSEDGSS